MSNLKRMYKAVKYIEKNLKEDIIISQVAEEVGYSVYHFCRIFNDVIKHSPYEYIQRRRLTEAAKELLEMPNKKIIEIAFDYQFNNHETFSRAFKKMFGVQPNQLKKNKVVYNLIHKSEPTYEQIVHINKGDFLKPEFVRMEELKLVGMTSVVRESTEKMMSGTSIMTELWYKFMQEIENIPNKVTPERFFSVSFFSDQWDLDGFFHMVAIEVENLAVINPLLVGKIIPAMEYAKFIHKGLSRKVGLTYQYIYQTWLPKSNYQQSIPLEIEHYGKNYKGLDNPESESEIYIPLI